MDKYILNLVKDPPDDRDYLFKSEKFGLDNIVLPQSFDLRTASNFPPVVDQGNLGSCVPNQVSNVLRYCLRKQKEKIEFQPSRLYIYYFGRLLSGNDVTKDTGLSIRGGFDSVAKYGACSENNWGYKIPKFTEKPNDNAVKAGKTHIPKYKYIRVSQNLLELKKVLFGGFPIVCGIVLYNSFNPDKNGTINLPNKRTERIWGRHCVSIIGYDDVKRVFIMSNTWGSWWGNKGFFTLPYDYILDGELSADFWFSTFFK